MSEVLIVGASGKLGRKVAQLLLERGLRVRAGSRDPARVADLEAKGADAVVCDLRNTASLGQAVRGVDAVLHAAHALVPPRWRNSSARVDGDGVQALIDAAIRHDVRHFMLSSTIAAAVGDHPSAFIRAKHAAEVRLRASGMPHTILRMASFTQTHVCELLAKPIAQGKPVRVVGDGLADRNFVDVADAAAAAADRLTAAPPKPGLTLDVVGPENLSTMEAIAAAERALDAQARVQHLPVAVARTATAMSRLLYPPATPLLSFMTAEAEHGDAADLTPRSRLAVGDRTVDDTIAAWVRAHDAMKEGTAA